jgi:ribosomal protein S12 methylthiotransferase
VVPLMAENRILPYLDIPFQHASPRILRLMKRPGAVEKTLERVQNWRRIAPDITVRSTFIVGFPGETEAEFEELLSFLDEAQLDRVGAFAYSPVEGATANDLPDAVPEEVKQERLARFMEKQAQISAARLEAKIGTVQQCLVDAIEGDIAVARSKADAPEIDGLVHIQNADRCRCAWVSSSTWKSPRATSTTCTVMRCRPLPARHSISRCCDRSDDRRR